MTFEDIFKSIQDAATKQDNVRLQNLLPYFKEIPEHVRSKDSNQKLNKLLNEAAHQKANQTAKILIQFGADTNHYGDLIGSNPIIKCHFPEMLLIYGNTDLLMDIIFNPEVFVVYDNLEDNINNKHLNKDPEYSIQTHRAYLKSHLAEDKSNKQESELKSKGYDTFNLRIREKLMFLSMLCHFAITSGKTDLLETISHRCEAILYQESRRTTNLLKTISHRFEAILDTPYIIDLIYTNRCTRPSTSCEMIRLFQRAQNSRAAKLSANARILLNFMILHGAILFNVNSYNNNNTYEVLLHKAIFTLEKYEQKDSSTLSMLKKHARYLALIEISLRMSLATCAMLSALDVAISGMTGYKGIGILTISLIFLTIPTIVSTPYVLLQSMKILSCGALTNAAFTPSEIILDIFEQKMLASAASVESKNNNTEPWQAKRTTLLFSDCLDRMKDCLPCANKTKTTDQKREDYSKYLV